MKVCFWVIAGVSIFVSQMAMAQETTQLERIVVKAEAEENATGGQTGPTIAQQAATATKTNTPIMETPRSVSVITEQLMADQGVQTVQDALVYSAGVYGAAFGFDTRGDWARVRGLEPEDYRDGLKWHFGYYNNTRPHPFTLERIEVLKGPASVLYGQGSPGGIINVVSKLPQEETRREAYVEYGSHNRKEAGVDMTGKVDESGTLLYRMIGVWRDSDTQVDYVPDDSYVFAPSFTWRPTDDTSLTVLANLQRNKSGSSAQFFPWEGTLLSAPNGKIPTNRFISEPGWDRYDTQQAAITAIFDHRFNETWSVSARMRYSDSKADYDTIYPVFPPTINPDGRTIDRVAYMSAASAQVFTGDARLRADFDTGAIDHKLAFGIDYQNATTENDYFYGSGGTIDLYDPVYGNIPTGLPYYDFNPATTRQTGFYVTDQIKFGSGWIASVGLRYDVAKDADGKRDNELSKDFGLMYEFDNGVAPYVSYSESFVPVTGTDFNGDPFKPLRGKQYEAGVKFQPPGTPSIVTAAIFQIEQENMLLSDPSNPLNQIQSGEARIRGVELEAQTKWNEFELLANYTYLDTRGTDGYRLDTVPEHMASAWLSYRPEGEWEGFKAGFGLRYVGKTWDGVDKLHTDPYLLADAMIGYETDRWAVALVGRNLFDKVHLTSCLARGDCFYGDRRSVALNVSTKF
jgi:iron complex outermembrane receptor protein